MNSANDPVNDPVFDAVVVGLGPVGELAALLLAREGLRVLALEKEPTAYSLPRVGVLDGEALRTLQKAGVYETASREMLLGAGAQWASRTGEIIATVMPTEHPQGHPWISSIYQPLLDQQLREALHAEPRAEIRTGRTVTGMTQSATCVTVDCVDTDGTAERISARYVLGCDGANSIVRTAIGATLRGSDFSELWLIVDAKMPEPISHVPYFVLRAHPAGPRMNGRLAGGHHRWERQVLPGEDASNLLTSKESARRMIAEHADPDTAVIDRHITYTFRAHSADRWRVGRVLLAGDAAHLMPPMVGQGLNSGIRDATNLAWKIAAVVRDGADPALLDSYQAEREPHIKQMTRLSVTASHLIMMSGERRAALRDGIMKTLMRIGPVRESVRQGRFRPPANYRDGLLLERPRRRSPVGKLFPQPRVRLFDGSERLLEDVTGSGWRIVGWNCDPRESMSDATREVAERDLGATFLTLRPLGSRNLEAGADTDDLEDIDGYAQTCFRRQPFVLVRPDHYVCANPSGENLDFAVRRVTALVTGNQSFDDPVPAASADEPAIGRTGTWRLDPETAHLQFRAKGLWGLLPVAGDFGHASGTLTWQDDGVAMVTLDVRAASVRTGIGFRDQHLRAEEFLDADRHPHISFVGESVKSTPTAVHVVGNLTVRGVSQQVTIRVDVASNGSDLMATASTQIDLEAFGIEPPLGMVRPQVHLTLSGRLQSTEVPSPVPVATG